MLNSSISLDAPVDDTEDASLMGLIEDEAAPDMEEHIIAKEEIRNWERTIHLVLTPSEKEVLRYYMEGKHYQDIADAMNKTVKSVNNTMQRIRKSCRNTVNEANQKVWDPRRGSPHFFRRETTGYAGGREEFYLWMEKENLR